MALNDKKVADP